MDIEFKNKCISCKHYCEATSECRKHAPSGTWPKVHGLEWCGDYVKSKKVEFDK